MLDKSFSNLYNVDQKIKFLEEEFGIAITEAVSKGVEDMCNYSDYVEERGEQRGMLKERLLNIRNLMDSLNVSKEKAMEILKLSAKEQAELMPLI